MDTKAQENIVRVIVWVALVGLVVLIIWAVPTIQQGGQYKQIGETALRQYQQQGQVAEFMYVADSSTQEYWVNTPVNANAIPESKRVYILDDQTLAKFKGYRPGS